MNVSDDTFPKLLVRNAERYGDRTAYREKVFGIWQPTSWAEYLREVREISLGLTSLGVGRGDKVAILGDNRPAWICAELAAQSAGAASVGIYQDSNLNEVAYVIDHCDAKVVVAEDQEQVDKILEMIDRLPKVQAVVYDDPRGLRSYKHPLLMSLDSLKERGRALDPAMFDASVRAGNGEDLALICYTSGTTGFPKGAMLSYRNLLTMALSLNEVDQRRESDEFVSFLPLAWIFYFCPKPRKFTPPDLAPTSTSKDSATASKGARGPGIFAAWLPWC